MSQRDLDRVRDGFAEWKRTRELDLHLLAPDIDLVIHGSPAGDISLQGREGFREWLKDQRLAFGDFWWEIEDLREGRDGRILALIVAHAVGRQSGVAATRPFANLWTFEDGLAKRLEIFLDRAAAIEAADLPE